MTGRAADAVATATPRDAPWLTDASDAVADVARRQRWRWGLALAALVVLSIFSAGFFLYAAWVVVGLFVIAVAVVSISLDRLEIERRLTPTELELGEQAQGRLALVNDKALPALWLFWQEGVEPGLDLEGPGCAFETLGPHHRREISYQLHSTRRGFFRIGPALVEASGPFGLVRRFLVDRQATFVTVMPRAVDIGQGWPMGHRPIHEVPHRRSLFEDPSRFLGVRDYRAGDSLRRVHWRATARSSRLQVKLFEPAVLEGALLAIEMGAAAFPSHGARPDIADATVELAVTSAASLMEYVLVGGQAVGLVSNGSDAAERYASDWTGGTFRRLDSALAAGARRKISGHRPLEVEPGRGAWQRQRLRTALARLDIATGASLAELLTIELPRLPRSLVLFWITPLIDPALATTVESLRRSGIEVAVIWIGAGAADLAAAASLPGRIPIYPVSSDADLEQLGARGL